MQDRRKTTGFDRRADVGGIAADLHGTLRTSLDLEKETGHRQRLVERIGLCRSRKIAIGVLRHARRGYVDGAKSARQATGACPREIDMSGSFPLDECFGWVRRATAAQAQEDIVMTIEYRVLTIWHDLNYP